MNKEKLRELSIEDLEKKANQTKTATSFLAGLVLVLYIVTIASSITNGEFDYMMIVAIALTSVVISSFQQIKKLKEEIQSRNPI